MKKIALYLAISYLLFAMPQGRPDILSQEETAPNKNDTGITLFNKIDPAVVAIQHEAAAGSGFIITPDGYILSNGHVIMGNIGEEGDPCATGKRITVILSNDKKYQARVIGHCLDPDVALIKIEPDGKLPTVKLGDSNTVKTGQKAYAFGTPLGMKRTFTAGIISNIERANLPTLTTVIQTDAPINHGNSGGPLFNENGEVIGITTYKQDWGGAEGLGFVIPINIACVLKEHFLKYGRFRRADIPFYFIQPLYDELSRAFGIKEGVLVDYVEPDSLIEQAGMATGDIIIEMNDQPVSAGTNAQARDFGWKIMTQEIGTPIKFKILRIKGGKITEHIITATLIEDEPAVGHGLQVGEIKELRYDELGLGIKQLTALTYYIYNLPRVTGVRVTSAASRSPAAQALLKTNDIITHLDDIPIKSIEQFQQELESRLLKHAPYIRLTACRDKLVIKTALKPNYQLAGKKIALILPEKDIEYFELIKRILIENGAEVTTTAKTSEITVSANLKIKTDVIISDLQVTDFDGLILLGGTGAQTYWDDKIVHQIIRTAVAEKKVLGALGNATITLLNAEPSLLEKKITTDEESSKIALAKKANYTGKEVEKDGNIITSTGFDAGAIKSFLSQLKAILSNPGK